MSASVSRMTAAQDVRGSAAKLVSKDGVERPSGFDVSSDGMREIRKFLVYALEDLRYTVETAAARRMRKNDFEEVQAGAVVIAAYLTEHLATVDAALVAADKTRTEQQ